MVKAQVQEMAISDCGTYVPLTQLLESGLELICGYWTLPLYFFPFFPYLSILFVWELHIIISREIRKFWTRDILGPLWVLELLNVFRFLSQESQAWAHAPSRLIELSRDIGWRLERGMRRKRARRLRRRGKYSVEAWQRIPSELKSESRLLCRGAVGVRCLCKGIRWYILRTPYSVRSDYYLVLTATGWDTLSVMQSLKAGLF